MINSSSVKRIKMTKNNPLISVIVPVYNSAEYLPVCLSSILGQTYQNLEVICINDGSTDNSAKILQNYVKKDSRIKNLTQKNAGLSAARNSGIKAATVKYLTFVDADDQIKPTMLKDMLTAIQDSKANIAVCSFEEIYPNGKIAHFNKNHSKKIYDTTSALKTMLKEEGFMLSATMKLFPTKYFKNVKFPIGKLHEDVGTTYKLIMQAPKIVFLPNEYYIYNHHNNSIIKSKFDKRKLDLIILTDQMCNDIDQKYPALKNVTNERRMRARFSILRQIPTSHPEVKNLLKYLKNHKNYITQNPAATTTDKLALKLAITNLKLFQLAYKLKKI